MAIINPPYRLPGGGGWITVPPQGYGGIQWVVAHLIRGLLAGGHQVILLGAPGSVAEPGVTVVNASSPQDFAAWAAEGPTVDIVHDHTNGLLDPVRLQCGFISTHHLTGPPIHPRNSVYVSHAQRGSRSGPVIPLPVDPSRYQLRREKDDYLLFLGRVSPHKGASEAAAFAAAAGRRLLLAGPSWEPHYRARIESHHVDVVEFLGEVGGASRTELIAGAAAVLVLSQSVPGPWGHHWVEPGATVVSEAAVSGTPVVATHNGCLAVVANGLGAFVSEGPEFIPAEARRLLTTLPGPDELHALAVRRWNHVQIAERYAALYRQVMAGRSWGDD